MAEKELEIFSGDPAVLEALVRAAEKVAELTKIMLLELRDLSMAEAANHLIGLANILENHLYNQGFTQKLNQVSVYLH